MKTTVGIIIAFAIVSFLFACCGPLVEPAEPRRKLKAESQVRALETALYATWNFNSNAFPEIRQAVGSVQLTSATVFEAFSQVHPRVVLSMDPDWEVLRRFTDPWKHDYQFFVERQTNFEHGFTLKANVRSVGPNGVDEHGVGDDINSRGIELL